MPPDAKGPPGANKTRSEKVITAIDGDDEFSVASVDPEVRRYMLELKPPETAGKVHATGDSRKIWRLFRKIFS